MRNLSYIPDSAYLVLNFHSSTVKSLKSQLHQRKMIVNFTKCRRDENRFKCYEHTSLYL